MPTPREKLAASLEVLGGLQEGGRRVFRSSEFTRTHRARLVRSGYLREVMKGWLVSWSPEVREGDTTPFFATFWEFCAAYCAHRFGDAWHLSAEVSMMVHAEAMTVLPQVVVCAADGANNNLILPFGTSLYDLRQPMPASDDLEVRQRLRVFRPDAALVRVSERFFVQHPTEVQAVLGSMRDIGPLLARLLAGGHSTIAGRIAGALRRIGRSRDAERVVNTMTAAHYAIRETDPFDEGLHVATIAKAISPIAARLTAFWERHRSAVLNAMPAAPGRPEDRKTYLKTIQEAYELDAYHSLSIEGYSVTPDLIERVKSGSWTPEANEADRQSRDALAARGYFEAFQRVREDISAVLDGADAAQVWDRGVMDWYVAMFSPSVSAGLLEPADLAGFRGHPVYIRGSLHAPPRVEALPDAMETLSELLAGEEEASVRAVLGHWLFGYVHPFPDGNGRIARFTMNLFLASGGYPWTVIRVDDRSRYMATLEEASVRENLAPFSAFVAESMAAPRD
jgi:hypothetical protein